MLWFLNKMCYKTAENEIKNQSGRFLGMLLGALGASLLRIMSK